MTAAERLHPPSLLLTNSGRPRVGTRARPRSLCTPPPPAPQRPQHPAGEAASVQPPQTLRSVRLATAPGAASQWRALRAARQGYPGALTASNPGAGGTGGLRTRRTCPCPARTCARAPGPPACMPPTSSHSELREPPNHGNPAAESTSEQRRAESKAATAPGRASPSGGGQVTGDGGPE